jgi:hypothetical protein
LFIRGTKEAFYERTRSIRDQSNKQNDDVGTASKEAASYKSMHPLRERSNVPLNNKQAW